MSSLPHQLAPEAGHDDVTAARVEELYTSHVALVRSVCRSLLRDRIEAEDAVQQTFLSAQRALLNGSSPRDAAAWLATIARHESLARVRARMRDPLPVETEAEAGGPDAYAVAVTRQEVGELRDALADLPAQQRDAILMRELRGLSYEEVASELLITPTAVRSLLFRARQSLQVRLREALASFSPGFAFRDLLGRAGGGVAGPAAAKAVAVGLGAAIITGGALVGPRVIGLRPAPSTHRAAQLARSGIQPNPSVMSERPSRLFAASRAAAPKPRPPRTQGGRHDGASTGGGASSSDVRGDAASAVDGTDSGSGSHDGSGSDGGDTGATSSGSSDTSSTSDAGGSGSNDGSGSSDGGTQTTSSGSGDTSTTSDGGDSGSNDSSSSSSGDSQPPSSGTDG
jgi:RNA polymerase sigma-70 factor, ECF subfamily